MLSKCKLLELGETGWGEQRTTVLHYKDWLGMARILGLAGSLEPDSPVVCSRRGCVSAPNKNYDDLLDAQWFAPALPDLMTGY